MTSNVTFLFQTCYSNIWRYVNDAIIPSQSCSRCDRKILRVANITSVTKESSSKYDCTIYEEQHMRGNLDGTIGCLNSKNNPSPIELKFNDVVCRAHENGKLNVLNREHWMWKQGLAYFESPVGNAGCYGSPLFVHIYRLEVLYSSWYEQRHRS